MHREPHSPGGRDRAQTAQDFAVGIGLFLLAVAFVFGFVPYVISPYDAGASAAQHSQADRAATNVVGDLSQPERPNELNATATAAYFGDVNSADDLRNRTGLPFDVRINASIRNVMDGDVVSSGDWSAGDGYRERFGGVSATRIVRTDDPGTCEPACRLIVRVW